MRIPRPRLDGPLAQRDASVLLAFAAGLVVTRLPMGFLALLAVPALVIIVQGWRRRAPWPGGLRALLLWCLLASGTSVLLFHPSVIASTGNNAIIMTAVLLMAASVFTSRDPRRASDRIIDGLCGGLLLVWAVSIFEAGTGFKFMPLLYPNANTVAVVASHRFYVAAFFPNYNDYSVAMALLVTMMVARMLFRPRVQPLIVAMRWVVVLTSCFFIFHMGSRGALVGIVVGIALMVVLSVRTLHPHAFGPRFVVLSSMLAVALVLLITQSPWFQDNSTAKRGVILTNITQMMAADPISAMIGWGSATTYQLAASQTYGTMLMDPHNVLAEIAVWYGLPALVGYVLVWGLLMWRGVVKMQLDVDWRSASALCIAALMPVLGVVPSSTLRFHVFWLWLIAAASQVMAWRRAHLHRPAAPAPAGGREVSGANAQSAAN